MAHDLSRMGEDLVRAARGPSWHHLERHIDPRLPDSEKWLSVLRCPNGCIARECSCPLTDELHTFWLYPEGGSCDILSHDITTVDTLNSIGEAAEYARKLRDMEHPDPVDAEYGRGHHCELCDDQDPIGDVDNLADREPGWRM